MFRVASVRLVLAIVALLGCAAAFAPTPAEAQSGGPFQYFALTPCRAVDTRNAPGTNGGPRLFGNAAARNFQIQGVCGVPVGAKATTINVTIVQPTSTGFLTLWPSGGSQPTVSTLDFGTADTALANGAIVPLSTNAADLSVFMGGGTGSTHVLIDITGYFM
jgi:hypothetical protein